MRQGHALAVRFGRTCRRGRAPDVWCGRQVRRGYAPAVRFGRTCRRGCAPDVQCCRQVRHLIPPIHRPRGARNNHRCDHSHS